MKNEEIKGGVRRNFFRLAPPQAVKKPVWGGLEDPQALQNEIVSHGFAGRAGSLRPLGANIS